MTEHPEACAEWQESIAAFVTAQIAPGTEAALSSHIASCARCRDEVDSLTTVSATVLGGDPAAVMPPADGVPSGLGDRVVATVTAEGRRRRHGWLLAAVAGLVAVAIGVWAVWPEADIAPLQGREVAFTTAADGVAARAVIAGDADGSLVDLEASGLDPGSTYALWLSPPGASWEDRVPAGTFRADESGFSDVRLPCSLPAEDVDRVWATDADGALVLDTE